MALNWTGSKDIKRILLQKWEKGYILQYALGDYPFFPFNHKLVSPAQSEVVANLSKVIDWRKGLIADSKAVRGYGYEILEKEFHYSVLGKNSIPVSFCVNTLQDAVKLIGKQNELEIFNRNSAYLLASYPSLKKWIEMSPFKVVALDNSCEDMLKVLDWFVAYKERYMYIRQLEIDGVDTKFIENNCIILNEMLTEILSMDDYKPEEKRFEHRYGLKTKPELVRFRILDKSYVTNGITDITVPISELCLNNLPFSRIFITENEINFLSFPEIEGACVFFGRGYGVDILRGLPSINDKEIFYWGDIDTHGFNILGRARSFLPQIKSFLMTEEILLEHQKFWVNENKPFLTSISNLTDTEYSLACKLQTDYFGHGVRLEQERVQFAYVADFIDSLRAKWQT